MDLSAYKLKTQKKKGTREQDLADQIFKYFNRRINFSRLMKIIQRCGYKAVWEIWSEVKQSNCNSPVGLFLWKCKNEKIEWT